MNELRQIMSSSFDQDLILKGWFENHPAVPGVELPRTPETEAFISQAWPMSTPYFNPLGAIFVVQVVTLQMLNARDSWFVRDGLIPLLWFFRRFPRPSGLRSKLFVDEDLLYMVPDAWLENVGTYRIHSEAPKTASSRAMILGLAADTYCSLDYAAEGIAAIAKKEAAAGVTEFDTFTPARIIWNDEQEQAFHSLYFRNLWQHLPLSARVLSRNEVVGTFDMQNLRVYDLNEKMLIADSAITNELLKRGAQWPDSKPAQPGEEFIRISAYHGYILNRRVQGSPASASLKLRETEAYHQRLQNVLNSRAFKNLPWPRWFADWVKAAADTTTPQATAPLPAKISVAKVAQRKAKRKKR